MLAEVVLSAFQGGKRILVCSNTNKAVDQLLYKTCEAMSFDHPALEEGRIVRIGTIVDDKLRDKYSSHVTIDGIVTRKSVELKTRWERVQEAVNRIDILTAQARDVVELFERLDAAEKTLGACQQTTNDYARRGNVLKTDLRPRARADTEARKAGARQIAVAGLASSSAARVSSGVTLPSRLGERTISDKKSKAVKAITPRGGRNSRRRRKSGIAEALWVAVAIGVPLNEPSQKRMQYGRPSWPNSGRSTQKSPTFGRR